jgi:ubiquinone/menaquinone biosynthesis C-methylase UbiE
MTDQIVYALGSSEPEHRRLMVQSRLLRQWSERFLRAGGLRPGMSVLDLGSGIGDVSLLAEEIVGPSGHVLGIDRDAAITEKARRRVETEGLSDNVTFEVRTLEDFDAPVEFDAVIGRYVLLYLPDPAAALRRFAKFLRPGGVLVFHDLDMEIMKPSWPPCPIWDDSIRLLLDAFYAGGAEPTFGRQMKRAFIEAGLPNPALEASFPIANRPESPVLDWIARTLNSLAPVIDRASLPLPPGFAFDNLVETWAKAMLEQKSQFLAPIQYGAWTRLP